MGSETSPHTARIITFYSYKGGTGRTMALANVAWLLASNGKRVLVIDWDLEAPGLHRYFAPFLDDPECEQSEGLVDWLSAYMLAATRKPSAQAAEVEWHTPYADLARYAQPINWPSFYGDGALEIVCAGRQTESYGTRINEFDWSQFYRSFGGAAFLDEAMRQLRTCYDYVLIDSRTGVADTAGICTMHLPDDLVVLFTLSNQSIHGASHIAQIAYERRHEEKRPLRIFPIITRVALEEKDKLDVRRRLVHRAFASFPNHLDEKERRAFRQSLEILYNPYYAYEEVLATIGDDSGQPNSVLAAIERLGTELTDTAMTMPPLSQELRNETISAYAASTIDESAPKQAPGYDVFLVAHHEDRKIADKLFFQLQKRCRVFMAERSVKPGTRRHSEIERVLQTVSTIVIVLSQAFHDDPSADLKLVLKHLEHDERVAVIPVLLDEHTELGALDLEKYQFIRLRDGDKIDSVATGVLATLGLNWEAPEEKADQTLLVAKLEAKLEARVENQQQERKQAEDKLRRTGRWIVLVSAVAVLAMLVGVTAWWQQSLQLQERAASADQAAEEAKKKAEEAKKKAEEAKKKTEKESQAKLEAGYALLEKEVIQFEVNTKELRLAELPATKDTVDHLEQLDQHLKDGEALNSKLKKLERDIGVSSIPVAARRDLIDRVLDLRASTTKTADQLNDKRNRLLEFMDSRKGHEYAKDYWLEGRASSKNSDWSAAKNWYEKALSADKNYVPAHNSLGVVALRQNDKKTAREHFKKALELDNRYVPALLNLAGLLLQSDNPNELEDAEKLTQQVLDERPGYTRAEDILAAIRHKKSP